jgi:AraC-like DNA-binding protein
MMPSKTARLFLYVAGVLLLATATAKLISSFGGARILGSTDPVTGLTFRNEFRLGGAVELLRDGSSVKETAAILGYEHATHFSREFKKRWGHSPSAEAKKYKAARGN